MRKKLALWAAVGTAALLGTALPASAVSVYTPVGPPSTGEFSLEKIVKNIYGSSLAASGNNFTDGLIGGITLTRVVDSDSTAPSINGRLNLVSGSPDTTDQVWTDGVAFSHAQARYAGFGQSFGIVSGITVGAGNVPSGGTYQDLISVTGSGMNPSQTPPLPVAVPISGPFLFARQGPIDWNNTFGTQTSADDTTATDNVDRMVTYKVTGVDQNPGLPGTEIHWLLAFEDGVDGDYNDLVVEVVTRDPARQQAMPLPGSLAMGAVGLLGVIGLKTRQALRRA